MGRHLRPIRPPGVLVLVLEHVSDLLPRMAEVLPLPQDSNVAHLLALPGTSPRAALQGAEQFPEPPPARRRSNLRPSEVEVRFLLRLHSHPARRHKQTRISKSGLAGGTPAVSPPDTSAQELPEAPSTVAPWPWSIVRTRCRITSVVRGGRGLIPQ
jgi:hypothetical protein